MLNKRLLSLVIMTLTLTAFGTQKAHASSLPQGTNLMINGNFEEYSGDFRPGPNHPWKTTAADNIVEIWDVYRQNYYRIYPTSGQRLCEINANGFAAMYQDLKLNPGETIKWSIDHRGRDGVDTMDILIGAPGKEAVQQIAQTGTSWKTYSGQYTVPAGQTTTRVMFKSVATYKNSKASGNLIDNVIVKLAAINEKNMELYVGDKGQIELGTLPKDVQINYKNSNNNIATVSSTGQVTGVTPGKTVVTVSAKSTTLNASEYLEYVDLGGARNELKFYFKPKAAHKNDKFRVVGSYPNLMDQSVNFARVDGDGVFWSNVFKTPSYQLDSYGRARGNNGGVYTLYVNVNGQDKVLYTGKDYDLLQIGPLYIPNENLPTEEIIQKVNVTVKEKEKPKPTLDIKTKDLKVTLNKTVKSEISYTPSNAAVTYECQDPSIISINTDGVIKGIKVGETTVKVTIKDEYGQTTEGTFKVTVNPIIN